MMNRRLIAALINAAIAFGAQAQEVKQYRAGDRVDPRDVARIIGQPKADSGIKTRSIRMMDDAPAEPSPVARDSGGALPPVAREGNSAPVALTREGSGGLPPITRDDAPSQRPIVMAAASPREERVRPAAQEAPSALSLPVQFRFDSADILPQARAQLDAIAEGLKMLPPAQRMVIEGHTDGVGGEAYNLELSNRRAVAVKRYLMSVHQIDGSRLVTEGYGKFRPLNAGDLASGENRRVQFRGA